MNKTVEDIWLEAETHARATKTYNLIQNNQGKVCQCCFRSLETQPVPICINTKQLDFLGFGIPIYFVFIHSCIILLLVSIFSYSIPELYQNYMYNFGQCNATHSEHHLTNMRHFSEEHSGHHQDLRCQNWMIKISSTQNEVSQIERGLRICSFMLHIIFLIYIRNKQKRLYNYYDEKTCSLSDYTIMITKIPKGKRVKQKLRNLLLKNCDDYKIEKIIMIPTSEFVDEIEKQKHQLEVIYDKYMNKHKNETEESKDIESQIIELEHQIHQQIKQMQQDQRNDNMISQTAIVIFGTEHYKNQFLEKFHENKKNISPKWRRMKVQEASEPEEIIWENIGLDSLHQKIRSFLSYLMSFLVLVLVTVVFAKVIEYKTQKVEELIEDDQEHNGRDHSFKIHLIVYGSLLGVVLFNKLLLVKLFHKFTDFQKKTASHIFQFSFCLKYCLGLFFTTAVMTLIVEDFMFHNFFKHQYGVIEMESIMFILNSTFVPIFWAINPYYLAKKIKRVLNRNSGKYITQQKANYIMSDPAYEVGKRYGEILQLMWFTYLYFSLIPMGAILSCFGLGLYYWVDKYNLLRKSSIEIKVSGKLSELTLNLLDVTLFWRTASEILYDYQIRDGIGLSSWIMLGVSVIYIVIPTSKVIDWAMAQKFEEQQKPFKDVKHLFKVNYFTSHILYSKLQEDKQTLAKKLQVKLVRSMLDEVKIQQLAQSISQSPKKR